MEQTEEKKTATAVLEYEIYNLGCAAAMVALGYEMIRVQWDSPREEPGSRATFIFLCRVEEAKEDLKKNMIKYQGYQLSVDAKKFYFSLATVRTEMYGEKT